jgi:hypothetical protein
VTEGAAKMTLEKTPNKVIYGPPGCGKTFFLTRMVNRIMAQVEYHSLYNNTSPILLCSLTRTAAAEIASRTYQIPPQAIATLHAHGWRSQGRPACINQEDIRLWNERYPLYRISSHTVDMEGESLSPLLEKKMTGNQLMFKYHRLRHMMIHRSKWPVEVLLFADKWENWKAEVGKIDFSDMIEFASSRPPLDAKYILVDEAQDTSLLAFRMLERWGEYATLIYVGDPYQSLYEWAGAAPGKLLDVQPGWQQQVLSQSYRVPEAVQKFSMGWIPKLSHFQPIEYLPRVDRTGKPVPGLVKHLDVSLRDPAGIVQAAVQLAGNNHTVMLITSCNYMLNPLLKTLKERGVPFSNPWRRKEKGWNPLYAAQGISMAKQMLTLFHHQGPDWKTLDLHQVIAPLRTEGLMVHGAKVKIEKMAEDSPEHRIRPSFASDLFTPEGRKLFLLFENDGEKFQGVRCWIDHLINRHQGNARYCFQVLKNFGSGALEEEPRIFIGTAHSFKGAEADHVLLFPDLSPDAHRSFITRGPGADEIIRTFYVAMTRPRESLYLCRPKGRKFVEIPLIKY